MKVAFLDRDGVINKEVNYLNTIDDFSYIPKSVDALKLLRAKNYQIIVITNQAGIGKGLISEDQYSALTAFYIKDLKAHGIDVLKVYHCPHHKEAVHPNYRKDCFFRKPNPGMILHACTSFGVDRAQSILVGDKVSDVEAGMTASIGRCFLVRSGHEFGDGADKNYQVFDNLYHVAVTL